mgnify:CR=1 FL=1
MYSYEIENILENNSYVISSNIYKNILDTSNQIQYVKYNPYDNSIYIETSDGYSWILKTVN